MRYAHIVGWGKFVPERVMTNDDLSKLVNTSDEWIRKMTGIGQRHLAGPKDSCASMATNAALEALDVANISAAQVGLIIVATSTSDYAYPSTACLVQGALGADSAGAFDLSAACSGFVYALGIAADAIKAKSVDYALVIGSEVNSRVLDWSDRNTCVLFGDGAGAVVLQGSDQPGGVLSTVLRADGSGSDMLYIRNKYNELPGKFNTAEGAAVLDSPAACNGFLQMNGREVFRFATRIMDRVTRDVLNKAGWQVDEVDVLVPHQANIRIIESASRSLAIPLEKFFCNIERYGNTSAASIPIAICEAVALGRLQPHDKVVMVGFGGGLTWGAAAVQWGLPRAVNRTNRTLNRVRLSAANVRTRARRMWRRMEGQFFSASEDTHTSPVSPSAPAAPSKSSHNTEPVPRDPVSATGK
jgi:3-oxoacyl-[acyl-carrier-protein] synthase-3